MFLLLVLIFIVYIKVYVEHSGGLDWNPDTSSVSFPVTSLRYFELICLFEVRLFVCLFNLFVLEILMRNSLKYCLLTRVAWQPLHSPLP